MSEPDPSSADGATWRRFEAVQAIQIAEQDFFWQRFTAFSALVAGLLVLAASDSVAKPLYVKGVGLLLSFAWCLIQARSLYYVQRMKDDWFALRLQCGIDKPGQHPLPSKHDYAPTSSSFMGFCVTGIVFLMWIWLFLEEASVL